MRTVVPERMRASVEESGGELFINVPAPRSHARLYLPLFLLPWLGGEISLIHAGLNGVDSPNAPAPVVFWLMVAAWTLGGVYMLRMIVWLWGGSERIRIAGGLLRHWFEPLPFRRAREFMLSEIRRMRAAPVPRRALDPSDLLTGTIAFDYGARTYRIAAGVGEGEANALMAEIIRRHPEVGT